MSGLTDNLKPSKKVLVIFQYLQMRHIYYRRKQNTEALLFSTKSIILILISQRYLLLTSSRHFLCMYILFKNGTVCSLLLCNLIFSLSILRTSCHCPQTHFFHILFESCLFFIELLQILSYCCTFWLYPVFRSYKQNLTEWISLCVNLCTCPWKKYSKAQFWDLLGQRAGLLTDS